MCVIDINKLERKLHKIIQNAMLFYDYHDTLRINFMRKLSPCVNKNMSIAKRNSS